MDEEQAKSALSHLASETHFMTTPVPSTLVKITGGLDIAARMNAFNRVAALGLVDRLSPKLPDYLSKPFQMATLNVGADLTRLVTGPSTAAALVSSQAISTLVSDAFKPLTGDMARIFRPVEGDIFGLSQSLTESTRVLSSIRVPSVLEQATSDSNRGWQIVLRNLVETHTPAEAERALFAGTHAVGTSVAALMLLPVDMIDVDVVDPEPNVADRDSDGIAMGVLEVGERTRAALLDRLSDVHPRLAERLAGAWETLGRAGLDAASQAAHSIQELIDGTLRELAKDDLVFTWYSSGAVKMKAADALHNGRPTRALRARYLVSDRPHLAHAADYFISSIGRLTTVLQSAKHDARDEHGAGAIQAVLLSVEGCLAFMLLD